MPYSIVEQETISYFFPKSFPQKTHFKNAAGQVFYMDMPTELQNIKTINIMLF